MKKKIILFITGCLTATAIVVSLERTRIIAGNSLISCDVEALSECDISKNGKIHYFCKGNEGHCTASKLGYTLTCTGKKVAK